MIERLNDPRLINRIKRRYDLRGEGPILLGGEVIPVALVDELLPEHGTAVDRVCISAIRRTSTNYACIQLWNYSGSGVVVHFDRILLTIDSTSRISGGHYDTKLGTTVLNPYADNRISGNAVSAIAHGDEAAALTMDEVEMTLASSNPLQLDMRGVVLKEDTGYAFCARTTGKALHGTFYWRERPIRDLDEPT